MTPQKVDTYSLDVAMMRDGTPSHIREAVATLVYHVAIGHPIGEHVRRALAYVLDVRPSSAVRPGEPTHARVRAPEVF